MKYGLPRDEKPQKKWKIAMENEIKTLKIEVCFLREQLDNVVMKLTQSSEKPPHPLAFIQDLSGSTFNNPFDQQINNNKNIFAKREETVGTNQCFRDLSQGWCHFTPCGGNGRGSRAAHYQPTKVTDFGKEYGSSIVSIVAMPEYQSKSLEEIRLEDYSFVARTHPQYVLTQVVQGTEWPRFLVTWDYDSVTGNPMKYHSITCMDPYRGKSLEELRYEDYVLKGIGFSNQVQRFKDSQLRSLRTEKLAKFSWIPKQNWKPIEKKHTESSSATRSSEFSIPWYRTAEYPPWPFVSTSQTVKTAASASTDTVSSRFVTSNPSFNPKQLSKRIQCTSLKNTNVDNSTTKESLSSQVVSEVGKIGDQLSAMNDQLSKMNSNISAISSRVNVMDSRLTAVDMFITMQRFNQKWQGLETRLVNLETLPSACIATPHMQQNITSEVQTVNVDISTQPLQQNIPLDIKTDNVGILTPPLKQNIAAAIKTDNVETSPTTCVRTPPFNESSPTEKVKDFSCYDQDMKDQQSFEQKNSTLVETIEIVGMNFSDFVRSVSLPSTESPVGSKNLYTSGHSHDSMVSNSPSNIKSEDGSIEMVDLKSSYHSPLQHDSVDTACSQDKESNINNSRGFVYSFSSKDIDGDEHMKESHDELGKSTNVVLSRRKEKSECELQVGSATKSSNAGTLSNVVEKITEEKTSRSIEKMDFSKKESELNVEEFVIIEKSDIEGIPEGNSKSQKTVSPSIKPSSSGDLNMYSDITEYLEINLGKKKNMVYEFGFEAKPDCSPESGESLDKECRPHESPSTKSSADDSFQNFMNNFTENKSVGVKQSTPFDFNASKLPKMLPGKTVSDRKQ